MKTGGDSGLNPRRIIETFGLTAHPEGGWYRRIIESGRTVETDVGPRPALTSIYYLLCDGEVSHPHRVRHDEIWHFLAGEPILLIQTKPDGTDNRTMLLDGTLSNPFSHCVPAGYWQAARPVGRWTFLGCTVAPGFDFDDFELAEGQQLDALLDISPEMRQFVR